MKIGIRFRLIVSLILLMAPILWLTSWVLIKDVDKRINEFRQSQAYFQAKTLAEGSLDALVTEDFELLERWVASSLPTDDYAYAALVRPNGQVLTHTNLMEIGEIIQTSSKPHDNHHVHENVYLGRPVLEVVHSSVLANRHLANAHIAYYIDVSYKQEEETNNRLIVIMLISSSLLMLGVYYISGRIINPIRQLSYDVSNFTLEKGVRFSQAIFNREDEIGELAKNFDKLSYSLMRSYYDLKMSHDEAINAKELAEYANEAKSDFMNNISHELRTPMHSILGFSDLGKLKIDSPEKVKMYFNMISESGARLLVIINDLLYVSTLDAGKYKIDVKQNNLYELAKKSMGEISFLLDEKNLKVKSHSNFKGDALFDEQAIFRVINNLLSNAIKYCDDDSEILVEIFKEDDEDGSQLLHFRIQDEGVQIPAREILTIFDNFVQSRETKSGAGGTGLGLTICKRIIEAHQGRIWAENMSDPKGSIFHFTIPFQD